MSNDKYFDPLKVLNIYVLLLIACPWDNLIGLGSDFMGKKKEKREGHLGKHG